MCFLRCKVQPVVCARVRFDSPSLFKPSRTPLHRGFQFIVVWKTYDIPFGIWRRSTRIRDHKSRIPVRSSSVLLCRWKKRSGRRRCRTKTSWKEFLGGDSFSEIISRRNWTWHLLRCEEGTVKTTVDVYAEGKEKKKEGCGYMDEMKRKKGYSYFMAEYQ